LLERHGRLLQHFGPGRSHTSGLPQLTAPLAGTSHTLHHVHQVTGDRPEPAAALAPAADVGNQAAQHRRGRSGLVVSHPEQIPIHARPAQRVVIGRPAHHHSIHMRQLGLAVGQLQQAAVELKEKVRSFALEPVHQVVTQRRNRAVLLGIKAREPGLAGMDAEAGDTGGSQGVHEGQEFGVGILVVDADPVFHRHRQGPLGHRLDAAGQMGRLGHQAGAEAPLLHPLAGAAHIQVDLVITPGRCQLGRLGQQAGIVTPDLEGEGLFAGVEIQQAVTTAVVQGLRHHHLGVEKAVAGDLPHQHPEVAIGAVHHRRHTEAIRGCRRRLTVPLSHPPMLPFDRSLVVAGGGPAGYMAAITAAEMGLKGVLLLEATLQPLGKVLISGGGRCNVTHGCWDPRALVGHYPRGSKALRGAFSRFAAGDTLAWFASRGLELVEEPDGRLFPRSNRSSSVVELLEATAAAAGVSVWRGTALRAAQPLEQGGFQLQLRLPANSQERGQQPQLRSRRLLLATGGHPSGRALATQLGHGVVAPVPSLFTLALDANPLAGLSGVVMDPVGLELLLPGQRFEQQGTALITHWGLSGPATLRLTAFAARALKEQNYRAQLQVDWSGGRPTAELEGAFSSARIEQAKRLLCNWRPWPELSRRLWIHLLEANGVSGQKRWADLGRSEQRRLITALGASCYQVSGRGPFGEEFVTAGGVNLGEVTMASMESRRQSGLFFAGELLDIDGVTGGFNFQHCWTSGWLAGQAIAAAAATETTAAAASPPI